MDVWLERLDKLISIIRPKAYNVIAKMVIGLGCALVVESQLNILQAIFISLYENFFGSSDLLREYFLGSSRPWFGFTLIVLGLVYHFFMTVGNQYVSLALADVARIPEFELRVLNADSEEYNDKVITLRGNIVSVPPVDDIPDYKVLPNMEGLSELLSMMEQHRNNSSFYKDRAEFLKIWGGSELIALNIFNNSEVMATGVGVEIKFPRIKGVSSDNTRNITPCLPTKELGAAFGFSPLLNSNIATFYDIKSEHTATEYRFSWEIGDFQASTSRTSQAWIFLRAEIPIDMEITICCDQISSPIVDTYRVVNSNEAVDVPVDALLADEDQFNELVSACIMDGYVLRKTREEFEESQRESEEFLPP